METRPPESEPERRFDPATVPPFPVLTLTGADDPENVSVDGEPITGENAYDRALQLCAQIAAEHGGAVRVRGVASDGTEWPMVITETGELHDRPGNRASATDKRSAKGRGPSRRGVLALCGLGAMVATVGGGAGAFIWAMKGKDEAPPPPPPTFPGRGANLPVRPPEGIATTATWAIVIDPDVTPQIVSEDRIVARTPDGDLVLLKASDGQVVWTGRSSDRIEQLSILDVDGHPVLTSSTRQGLDMWPLENTQAPTAQHLELAVNQAGAVAGAGSSPLFILEAQTAQFLAGTRLVTVDIPVPAIPAGVHAHAAVAVTNTELVTVEATGHATHTSLPQALPGDVDSARVLGDALLAVVTTTEQGAQLHTCTLPEGDLLSSLDLTSHRGNDEPLSSPSRSHWLMESILIGADGTLTDLRELQTDTSDEPQRFTPERITDHAIWGQLGQDPARYDLRTGKVTRQHPDAELPVADTETLTFIVAERLDTTSLYALTTTQ